MAQMNLPGWFREAGSHPCPPGGGKAKRTFVEKNLYSIASYFKETLDSDENSGKRGLLQGITPRARIAGVFFLLLASAFVANAYALGAAIFIAVLLAALSGIGFGAVVRRSAPAVVFTLIIVSPVFFGFFTPGERLVGLSIGPVVLEVTREGLSSGLFFAARVAAMVSLTAILLLSTGQRDLLRGLSGLPLPRFFVTALFMMFRFVFILLKTFEDTNLARRSRTISRRRVRESQEWFASRAALIMKKSLGIAEEVSMAMASRGFDGRVRVGAEGALGAYDYLWLLFTLFLLFLSFGLGR